MHVGGAKLEPGEIVVRKTSAAKVAKTRTRRFRGKSGESALRGQVGEATSVATCCMSMQQPGGGIRARRCTGRADASAQTEKTGNNSADSGTTRLGCNGP